MAIDKTITINGVEFTRTDSIDKGINKQDVINFLEKCDGYNYLDIIKYTINDRLSVVPYIDIGDMTKRVHEDSDYLEAKKLLLIETAVNL